jgi:hypothetical protein
MDGILSLAQLQEVFACPGYLQKREGRRGKERKKTGGKGTAWHGKVRK